MVDPRAIHKTVLREITETIAAAVSLAGAGVGVAKDIKNSKGAEAATNALKRVQNASRRGYGSLVKAANNLTLVFPVIASKTISINTDILIMKAIERKAVTMLQMVFSAIQIADKNVEDVYGYLAKFHKNLPTSDFSVDDIIQISDTISAMAESGEIPESAKDKMLRQLNEAAALKAIAEDMKKNTNYYMEDSINEASIGSYRISSSNMGTTVITEAINRKPINEAINDEGIFDFIINKNGVPETPDYIKNNPYDILNNNPLSYDDRKKLQMLAKQYQNEKNIDYAFWKTWGKAMESEKLDLTNQKKLEYEKELQKMKAEYDKASAKEKEEIDKRLARFKDELQKAAEKRKLDNDKELEDYKAQKNWQKDQVSMAKARFDMLKGQVLDSDIKKANELQPSMMVINFYVNNDKDRLEVIKDAVIGVKAKLYPMDSQEIIDRIDKKSEEQSLLVRFKRVTTRELSFFKDFLFALDKAKIDVVERNNKGSKAKLWQTLETRARAYKAGKYAGSASAAPITTLVVSQDEVEYLKKFKGIDLESYKSARKIFDGYNFMCICIVDESLEVAKFLFDTGEDNWEVLSFTSLDRESSDATYKKVVNLMTKIR